DGGARRKRAAERPAQIKTKRAKLNGNKTPQTGRKTVTFPPERRRGKWRNKERVRVFCSRGISFRTMMPHNTKMDQLFVVNEVCEIKNCNTCIFSEAKQQQDLNMWCVFVVHTLAELKMTGNCLKGSRPLLSFDPKCEKEPHHALLKELFTQIFSTPRSHPKRECVCVRERERESV
uniref:Ribosome biogenesis protein BRX1 homolog n=1 Tax=Cyprinus carpio TaxID=7962 RepID=A0A8C2B2Z4_CYPCA